MSRTRSIAGAAPDAGRAPGLAHARDPAPGLDSVPLRARAAAPAQPIAIGELARRSGVPASTLRYYEDEGLIAGSRSAGGRRQYPRHVLRRVGFIRAAQAIGLGLAEIRQVLDGLPDGRTPTKADWTRLAAGWRPLIDARIEALQLMRRRLDGCIGCGCLSLKTCALYNRSDELAAQGPGARHLSAALR